MPYATAAGTRNARATAPEAILPSTTSAQRAVAPGDAQAQLREMPARRDPPHGATLPASSVVLERREILGRVDVAGVTEVVAGHEPRLDDAQSLVRDARPAGAREEERMASHAAVGGGDDIAALRFPAFDHARQRLGSES